MSKTNQLENPPDFASETVQAIAYSINEKAVIKYL